ncbi:hypothetical protein [Paenibacillus sp. YYML68]|uniref:hypothetical protein n=1 Tax=Paenibacillus sp. YYML68 TaxID=2909250 RepID=UPI00249275FF|nr:hypothetical protein [Paenibacillus sp. YYML68]
MTDVKQHQMPMRHVVDNAEKAIQIAKDAEMAVRHAQLESNPNKLSAAMAEMEAAQHALTNAQRELVAQDDERFHQQLTQVEEQVTAALHSLDAIAANTQQPKQVR